jgi:hypothetical protein
MSFTDFALPRATNLLLPAIVSNTPHTIAGFPLAATAALLALVLLLRVLLLIVLLGSYSPAAARSL